MSSSSSDNETPVIRIDDLTTDNEVPSWEARRNEDDDPMFMQEICHNLGDLLSEDYASGGDGLQFTQGTLHGLEDSRPGGHTYEGDGLVPIEGTYDDLGDLLRCYEIEGIDGPFLTRKLLRHILTKDRIEAELRHSSPHLNEQQTHNYIKQILSSSEGERTTGYLLVFAVLLLIGRPGDIGNFINSGFCDHRLPIDIRPNSVHRLRGHFCFKKWSSTLLDAFVTFQWRVTTPFFGAITSGKVQDLMRLPLQTIKPWQKSKATEAETELETVDMSGAYGTVTRVDIHPTSHNFQDLLAGVSLNNLHIG
jgi:hypothetical protein